MIRKTVMGYQKVFEIGGSLTDYDLHPYLKEDTILWTGKHGGYFSLVDAITARDDEVYRTLVDYKKIHVPEDEWPVPEVRKTDIWRTSVEVDYEFSQEVTSFEIVEVRVR
jgi:hypothetical protein